MKRIEDIIRVKPLFVAMVGAVVALLVCASPATAQNVVSVTGGYGSSSDALYPVVKGRSLYGLPNFGVSWRSYSAQRYVGCFGIDLEYMKRGFSYVPNSSYTEEGEPMLYYTRKINTIVLPFVWQPHVYMIYRRVRVFGEAAVTFSYDISSEYDNAYAEARYGDTEGYVSSGEYEYMRVRDNRFGYGLTFGGGISLLLGRYEIMSKVRYIWGLSDVVKNRNKYYSNNIDGAENPFSLSPIRSSINGVALTFGVGYRFDATGFKSWSVKQVKSEGMSKGFGYTGEK